MKKKIPTPYSSQTGTPQVKPQQTPFEKFHSSFNLDNLTTDQDEFLSDNYHSLLIEENRENLMSFDKNFLKEIEQNRIEISIHFRFKHPQHRSYYQAKFFLIWFVKYLNQEINSPADYPYTIKQCQQIFPQFQLETWKDFFYQQRKFLMNFPVLEEGKISRKLIGKVIGCPYSTIKDYKTQISKYYLMKELEKQSNLQNLTMGKIRQTIKKREKKRLKNQQSKQQQGEFSQQSRCITFQKLCLILKDF